MKPVPQYQATVEQQHPAVDGVANLSVVGHVAGTYESCWQQAKEITKFPVIQFRELNHGQKC
jgi:hypothetical protein